jgi:hypothetical protein
MPLESPARSSKKVHIDLVRDGPAPFGTARVKLWPNESPYVPFGEVRRRRRKLVPVVPALNLYSLESAQRTEDVCWMALRQENAVSTTCYCGYFSAPSWQIRGVPEHLLTLEMAKLSVSKGCKLEELPYAMRCPEFLNKNPDLVTLAAEIHDAIMAWAPEGDVFL